MSTRSSIKWREHTAEGPGFHLFDDLLDFADDGQEPPVYLRLDGVPAEFETLNSGGASVLVELPREVARELGLLPAVARRMEARQGRDAQRLDGEAATAGSTPVDAPEVEGETAREAAQAAECRFMNLTLDLQRVLRGEPAINGFDEVEEVRSRLAPEGDGQ